MDNSNGLFGWTRETIQKVLDEVNALADETAWERYYDANFDTMTELELDFDADMDGTKEDAIIELEDILTLF